MHKVTDINGKGAEAHKDYELFYVRRSMLELLGRRLGCGLSLSDESEPVFKGLSIRTWMTSLSGIENVECPTLGLSATEGSIALQEDPVGNPAVQGDRCDNGMIMTARASVITTPTPTEWAPRDARMGKAGRYTNQTRVANAVMRAAARMSDLKAPEKAFSTPAQGSGEYRRCNRLGV